MPKRHRGWLVTILLLMIIFVLDYCFSTSLFHQFRPFHLKYSLAHWIVDILFIECERNCSCSDVFRKKSLSVNSNSFKFIIMEITETETVKNNSPNKILSRVLGWRPHSKACNPNAKDAVAMVTGHRLTWQAQGEPAPGVAWESKTNSSYSKKLSCYSRQEISRFKTPIYFIGCI